MMLEPHCKAAGCEALPLRPTPSDTKLRNVSQPVASNGEGMEASMRAYVRPYACMLPLLVTFLMFETIVSRLCSVTFGVQPQPRSAPTAHVAKCGSQTLVAGARGRRVLPHF